MEFNNCPGGCEKGFQFREILPQSVPKPLYVAPAVFVNKQLMEIPPGYMLAPCYIDADALFPETTLINVSYSEDTNQLTFEQYNHVAKVIQLKDFTPPEPPPPVEILYELVSVSGESLGFTVAEPPVEG